MEEFATLTVVDDSASEGASELFGPDARTSALRSPSIAYPAEGTLFPQGMLEVLFQYERSYDRLDAASAAAVWRGVDVRGLTRAFASLTSQDLSFDDCDLRIDESHATAQCRGGLKFVRRIGDPEPEERRVSWTIGFDNDEGRWVISSVKAK